MVTRAKRSSYTTAALNAETKNRALSAVAESLASARDEILTENEKDLEKAKQTGLRQALYKRLVLSESKIDSIIRSVRSVAALEDPVGRQLLARELDKDLALYRISVPIGVIGVIFESRPDALVQIASLCLKSGNAVILKGGKEALHTNRILCKLIREAAADVDPALGESVQQVESREDIGEMLKLDHLIDLMIPRGSNELVRAIKENTKIPVLGHTDGICHMYIHERADIHMAVELTYDAKCQYPAVCNAIETLLVDEGIAATVLPRIADRLASVELRGDEKTRAIINAKPATEEDWDSEYNDLILSIRIVQSVDDAIEHIHAHGSHHTDAIVSEDEDTAQGFLSRVDSSSVLWNASTRFADGFRYGLGAEVGISTNKVHARGPVGLEGLTTYKYKVIGSGHAVADYADGRRSFTHRDLP
jgi:glutamate-5-semialdehyde dehydrogenase